MIYIAAYDESAVLELGGPLPRTLHITISPKVNTCYLWGPDLSPAGSHAAQTRLEIRRRKGRVEHPADLKLLRRPYRE